MLVAYNDRVYKRLEMGEYLEYQYNNHQVGNKGFFNLTRRPLTKNVN